MKEVKFTVGDRVINLHGPSKLLKDPEHLRVLNKAAVAAWEAAELQGQLGKAYNLVIDNSGVPIHLVLYPKKNSESGVHKYLKITPF